MEVDYDQLWERQKRKQFELAALTPRRWVLVARDLKYAADKLFEIQLAATQRDLDRLLAVAHRPSYARS